MNPIAIRLLETIVEMLKAQQQLIIELQDEEQREVVDDASLTPRLNELLAQLQQQPPTDNM